MKPKSREEKISEAKKRWHAERSPADKKAWAAIMNEAQRLIMDAWTDEERAAFSAKCSAAQKKRHAEISPEAKARTSEKRRQSLLAYWADKKGRQKGSERSRKISEAQKRVQANLSDEERERRTKVLRRANKIAITVPRKRLTVEKAIEANRKRAITWTETLRNQVAGKIREASIARSDEEKTAIRERRLTTYHSRTAEEKAITSAKIKQSYRSKSAEERAEIEEKRLATKRENGSFHTSNPEDAAYLLLSSVFGADKVCRNHRTSVYPYACDFVINPYPDKPCRLKDAIFIECNFHWTHGGEPYDEHSLDHQKRLRAIRRKAKTSAYSRTALAVWTVRDVAKRSLARATGLSWFEFWCLSEVEDWLKRVTTQPRVYGTYSNDRLLKAYRRLVDGKPRFVNEFTFNFQKHFYREELRLWADPVTRCKLLANREKYLGKRSSSLTDQEILAGFRKASIARVKYSHFPVYLVKEFWSKTKTRFVYDPFAGWGTRLLTFNALGVKYLGNDSWEQTVKGCRRIVSWLSSVSSTKCKILHTDSALNDMRESKHDAVFTCPPYPLNVERYNGDAEDLPLAEYWTWWAQTVRMSVSKATRHFGLVVPEKWQSEYAAPIERRGFTLVQSTPVLANGRKDSHLVNRKNLEVMLIWKR